MHFERAHAAANTNPELAAFEFGVGGEWLGKSTQLDTLLDDFNLQYLELQARMQEQNASFTALSDIMKTKHDIARHAISDIR